MRYKDIITMEPGKRGGKPCIRGMRITVRRVLEILATYRERDEIFREYPFLEEEDLQQALAFAATTVDGMIDLNVDAAWPKQAARKAMNAFWHWHEIGELIDAIAFDFIVLCLLLLAISAAHLVLEFSTKWISADVKKVIEVIHSYVYAAAYFLFLAAFLYEIGVFLIERHSDNG